MRKKKFGAKVIALILAASVSLSGIPAVPVLAGETDVHPETGAWTEAAEAWTDAEEVPADGESTDTEEELASGESTAAEEVLGGGESADTEEELADGESTDAEEVLASEESTAAEEVPADGESTDTEEILAGGESADAEDILFSDGITDAEEIDADGENAGAGELPLVDIRFEETIQIEAVDISYSEETGHNLVTFELLNTGEESLDQKNYTAYLRDKNSNCQGIVNFPVVSMSAGQKVRIIIETYIDTEEVVFICGDQQLSMGGVKIVLAEEYYQNEDRYPLYIRIDNALALGSQDEIKVSLDGRTVSCSSVSYNSDLSHSSNIIKSYVSENVIYVDVSGILNMDAMSLMYYVDDTGITEAGIHEVEVEIRSGETVVGHSKEEVRFTNKSTADAETAVSEYCSSEYLVELTGVEDFEKAYLCDKDGKRFGYYNSYRSRLTDRKWERPDSRYPEAFSKKNGCYLLPNITGRAGSLYFTWNSTEYKDGYYDLELVLADGSSVFVNDVLQLTGNSKRAGFHVNWIGISNRYRYRTMEQECCIEINGGALFHEDGLDFDVKLLLDGEETGAFISDYLIVDKNTVIVKMDFSKCPELASSEFEAAVYSRSGELEKTQTLKMPEDGLFDYQDHCFYNERNGNFEFYCTGYLPEGTSVTARIYKFNAAGSFDPEKVLFEMEAAVSGGMLSFVPEVNGSRVNLEKYLGISSALVVLYSNEGKVIHIVGGPLGRDEYNDFILKKDPSRVFTDDEKIHLDLYDGLPGVPVAYQARILSDDDEVLYGQSLTRDKEDGNKCSGDIVFQDGIPEGEYKIEISYNGSEFYDTEFCVYDSSKFYLWDDEGTGYCFPKDARITAEITDLDGNYIKTVEVPGVNGKFGYSGNLAEFITDREGLTDRFYYVKFKADGKEAVCPGWDDYFLADTPYGRIEEFNSSAELLDGEIDMTASRWIDEEPVCFDQIRAYGYVETPISVRIMKPYDFKVIKSFEVTDLEDGVYRIQKEDLEGLPIDCDHYDVYLQSADGSSNYERKILLGYEGYKLPDMSDSLCQYRSVYMAASEGGMIVAKDCEAENGFTYNDYLEGTDSVTKFVPNEGYYVRDVYVDGVSIGAHSSVSINHIAKNHFIHVYFTEDKGAVVQAKAGKNFISDDGSSGTPEETPTEKPTETPTEKPTETPTETPTDAPAATPTVSASAVPEETPSEQPSPVPSAVPEICTVVFDLRGHGSPAPAVSVNAGEKLAAPAAPSKAGWIFEGWFKDEACSSAWDFAKDVVSSDMTLYAKWSKDVLTETPEDIDDSNYKAEERTDLTSVNATIGAINPKTYDGSAYLPSVKVTAVEDGKTVTLTEGTDYRVLYENNRNAGTAKVIVKGNGKYTGEVTADFTIAKKPITKLKVITGGVGIGHSGTLPIYVYDGSRLLEAGKDYVVSVPDGYAQSGGKKDVRILASETGNYTGEYKTKVMVYSNENILAEGDVKLGADAFEFTGKAIKPEVIVSFGGEPLDKKYYSIKYTNNKNAGCAYVTVTGRNGYGGSVVKPFEIRPVQQKAFVIKPIPDKTYNGKLQKPKAVVKIDGKALKEGRDYKVVYKNNLHASAVGAKASVTVIGIGNYEGTPDGKAEFAIKRLNIRKASVKGSQHNLVLTFSKRVLTEGIDYKVTYGETQKGKVPATIEGIGDFELSVTKNVKASSAKDDTDKKKQVEDDPGNGIKKSKPHVGDQPMADYDEAVLTNGYVDYSVALVKKTVREKENSMVSPLSVMMALDMAAAGAQGDTQSQIARTLCPDASQEQLESYCRDLMKRYETDGDVRMHIANSIWLNEAFAGDIKQDYLQKTENVFAAQAETLTFDDKAAEKINRWVNDNTDGMIPKIIGSASPEQVLYLVNATAVEAPWEEAYQDRQVNEESFTDALGKKKKTEMMSGEEKLYFESDSATGFLKYYKGRQYGFLAILPKDGLTVEEYLDGLTGEEYRKFYASRTGAYDVYTKLPKFTYEYDVTMNGALKELGVKDAFDAGAADFTGIAKPAGRNLSIDSVLHKTYIEVGQYETKAAAATVVAVGCTSVGDRREIKEVYLDRPFVYAIVDTETGAPIFMGTLQTVD